jgi:hypothetical protein
MAPRGNIARHDNSTCGIVMLRKLDARGCDKTKPRGFLTSLGPADGLRLAHAAHRFAHGRKRSIIRQTESIFPLWGKLGMPAGYAYIRCAGSQIWNVQKWLNTKKSPTTLHPIRANVRHQSKPSPQRTQRGTPAICAKNQQPTRPPVGSIAIFPAASLFAFDAHLLFRRLRCRIFTYSPDDKIVELLAGLNCRRKPSRLQSTSCPSFAGIFRIAVFRGDLSPCAAAEGTL